MIISGRVIMGLGVGIGTGTVPVYVAETAKRRLGGNLVSVQHCLTRATHTHLE
jgi:MFS family permease